METITILTPVFNRKKLMYRLYKSLQEQTVSDFVWMIVDDGSTDGLEQDVRKYQSESKFPIIYMAQENGGKHRALNRGIREIETEFTFIVDSDDYLPPDAIEIICMYHEKYKKTDTLCGYSFLRCYEDGTVNTAEFKIDEEIGSYRDIRINGKIGGDKAEVFYTKILQEYPFPEFKGETFLPEDVIWMYMSLRYDMVHINKCIYIGEYLEGGLTKTGRRMKINSPQGMILRSKAYLSDKKVKLVSRIKMMILYIVYNKFARKSLHDMYADVPDRFLMIIAAVPSLFIYHKWKRENDEKN